MLMLYLTYMSRLSIFSWVVSRYMQIPRESHAHFIKKILLYLHGTTSFGMIDKQFEESKLLGYSDSKHNVDVDDGRSTT